MKIIVVVVAVAGLSYFLWNHYFSRTARIERAYVACIDRLNAGMSKATPPVTAQTPGGDASAALAKGMGDAMTSMVRGMTSAMGGAMCSVIRDTCRQDFDGPVCQAALSGNR
jgi:hypothetical protein